MWKSVVTYIRGILKGVHFHWPVSHVWPTRRQKKMNTGPAERPIAVPDPRSQKAHLLVNYSEPACREAIQLLQQAGFRVFTAPATGIVEPELALGPRTYFGLDEIRDLVLKTKR
jgi:hypothetical protein